MGTVLLRGASGWRRSKYNGSTLYACIKIKCVYKNKIMKLIKGSKRRGGIRKSNRRN
jgi:hypothetical protein